MKEDEKIDAATRVLVRKSLLKISNPAFSDALMAKIEMETIEVYPKTNYKPIWLLLMLSFILVPFAIFYSSSFYYYINLLISSLTGFHISCFAQQIILMLLFTGLILAIASNVATQVSDNKKIENQAFV